MLFSDEIPFSRLDCAFARFLSQRTYFDSGRKQRFEVLTATLSQQQYQGHTCITITDNDKELLLESGLTGEIPVNPALSYPLIIEENRLYTQRFWAYENQLATKITRLAQATTHTPNLENLLDRYFPAKGAQTDWQREAAKTACGRLFSIITGGPGTGKTTTVCKILAILQELAPKPLLIALTAPTGKAAMRLQEAIGTNLAALNCPEALQEHIPCAAITLHRLLGADPMSPYFKHDATNPLIFDRVVVDEASMVDLALMSKLSSALKPGAGLILLGDKDQLASVESGAVLADLIAGLPDNTVELKHSYRFDGGIKKFSDAVNNQDYEAAWAILTGPDDRIELLEPSRLLPYITQRREDYVRLVKTRAGFTEIYRAFNEFQVLCSNRQGPTGALAVSIAVEHALFGHSTQYGVTGWYPGRPVIVAQNNPALHLYNGDIGICLPDREQNGNLMVFFQRPDGSVKKFLPARMPDCETVFATTVHKSQGSEFEDVLVVLPETANPVLSTELLYTAISRARKNIKLITGKTVFMTAVINKALRNTGLRNKLNKSG